MAYGLLLGNTDDVRVMFADLYEDKQFTLDKTGVKCLEIIGAQFIADEPMIFRKPDKNYIQREIDWYLTQDLNVNSMKGSVPEIWNKVADRDGFVNSNYGNLALSKENGLQFENCYKELHDLPYSRRAIMIYNRPSMHEDYKRNGMNDFVCAIANQFFIRNNKLESIVSFRSNDAIFGYLNDYAWFTYVHQRLYKHLQEYYWDLRLGNMIWQANSLHIYERHFELVEYYLSTGKYDMTQQEVNEWKINLEKEK